MGASPTSRNAARRRGARRGSVRRWPIDLKPYRRKYGRFPTDARDWTVDSASFAEFAVGGEGPRGAAALIWDRGRVLLLRHAPGGGWEEGWATPGGIAKRGETPEACLRRETREETGIHVRVTGLTKVILYTVTNEGRVLPFTLFQFEAEKVGGTVQEGEGITEVAWFDRLPEGMHFRADYEEPWMRRGRLPTTGGKA